MNPLRRALLALAVLVLGARVSLAAPMFPDVPDMWAADAVRALASKGLLEGYPDGTFKGDRAATRYETAMIVARFLAKMEQEHATFASKADLDELMKLAKLYGEELDAYGVKVTDLENRYAGLDKRVTELERITFYGNSRANGTFHNTAGANLIGTVATPAIDFTNGRLIINGIGGTGRALLGTQIRLNEDMRAGMELISYATMGTGAIEQYWGVTPNYFSNPFLGQGSIQPGAQSANNTPFNRMSFDRFWLQDQAHGYQLILGTYAARSIGDQILYGIRNPNVHAPPVLPFFGFQVTPLSADDRWQYEFDYSRLPQASFYTTWLGAGSSTYDFGWAKIGLSFARMANEQASEGQAFGAGLVILPTANGFPLVWRDTRTGTLQRFVGPQQQNLLGLNVNATLIPKKLHFRGNAGASRYVPDATHTLLDASANGHQFMAGLQGLFGEITADAEYVYADPNYDTMMFPYLVNPGLPVFLPYGNWYSSHYQLHDYLKYPINRTGPRVSVAWNTRGTRVYASYENLRQVAATTFDQLTTPGNAEPLFPVITTAGIARKGTTQTFGLGGYHVFDNGIRVMGSFYDYTLRRPTVAADDVDFGQRFYRLEVGKPLNDEFDVSLHYSLLDFSGHTGLTNRSFQQTIPGLTVSWTPARNVLVRLEGRLLNFNDRLIGANNWHGNQVVLDFNVDF